MYSLDGAIPEAAFGEEIRFGQEDPSEWATSFWPEGILDDHPQHCHDCLLRAKEVLSTQGCRKP